MSTPKLRIAVIGAGLIGPRHAQAIINTPDAELVGLVDPQPRAAAVAYEFGVPHFTSITALVQSAAKPDAAIICTPNHTHVAVSTELSSLGIHILIEKPFSTDIPSGEMLLGHLKTTSVHALVGHHRRFNPYMVATKRIVASGRLGTIIAVNGLWTLRKPMEYFDAPAEWRRAAAGGGVVLINMIHEVDLLHYLFGPIVRVYAEKTLSQRGFDAEEGGAVVFRFQSGLVGSFTLSDNVVSPYNFESGTGENPLIPRVGQDFYRVFGTEGTLSVPDMSVWTYQGGAKSWHAELRRETEETVEETVPFELQMEHFCRVIRGKEEASCTAAEGLGALKVCQAIKEALETDQAVEVEPFELK